jgi:hypothetical protein
MKQDRRGSWYLLTGTVLGVAMGLVYSWVVSPVRYIDAPPSALRADYKDDYRVLVASAYLYSSDLVRAEDRLAQLKDDESAQTLAIQAQRALAEGRPEAEVRALNSLASALNGGLTPDTINNTPTPRASLIPSMNELPSNPLVINPTVSPTVNITITPTFQEALITNEISTTQSTWAVTPSPAQGVSFVLQDKRLICNINQTTPLIQVEVLDVVGEPVPGVEVVVLWDGGEDHFFTGLKSELGLGYADFTMVPEVIYSIRLAGEDQVESNLTVAECISVDDSRYWGSWYLIYSQS